MRDDRLQIARIVETEAYRGRLDAACHAKVGVTNRTRVLYGPPGHAYVFLIYGMYDCVNVVGLADGSGHAVLIRGVEPVVGVEGTTNGPGRLTRALGITRADNGLDLAARTSRVFLAAREKRPHRITVTPRVGVAYAGEWALKPYRFYETDNPYVSRPPKKSIGLG